MPAEIILQQTPDDAALLDKREQLATVRTALAERHGVSFDEVIVGAGADGIIDLLAQATLDPGDDVVCGWPSFASYVLTAAKAGAEARRVPLRDHTYDLEGLLAADAALTANVVPTGVADRLAGLARRLGGG